jgi:CRISPR-associated endonuclease Cas3-HD
LRSVGAGAGSFAQGWPWADEARLAGLLHDLGKYGDSFQARLRGEASGLDHWSIGALEAFQSHQALGAALAIEGHHVGLQPALSVAERLRHVLQGKSAFGPALRLSDPDRARLLRRSSDDGLTFSGCASPTVPLVEGTWGAAIARMLDVRMLFSCLVDADFLDTEAHFNGTREGKLPREAGPRLDADAALLRLERHMSASVRGRAAGSDDVAAVRSELWDAAVAAAQAPRDVGTRRVIHLASNLDHLVFEEKPQQGRGDQHMVATTRSASMPPIVGFAALMHERKHTHRVVVDAIDQRVGKSAQRQFVRPAHAGRSNARVIAQDFARMLDLCQQMTANAVTGSLPVPVGGLFGFVRRCAGERNPHDAAQRWRVSMFRKRANTSSPSIISTSPLSMASTRRAISSSHARAISSGFASGSQSMLMTRLSISALFSSGESCIACSLTVANTTATAVTSDGKST